MTQAFWLFLNIYVTTYLNILHCGFYFLGCYYYFYLPLDWRSSNNFIYNVASKDKHYRSYVRMISDACNFLVNFLLLLPNCGCGGWQADYNPNVYVLLLLFITNSEVISADGCYSNCHQGYNIVDSYAEHAILQPCAPRSPVLDSLSNVEKKNMYLVVFTAAVSLMNCIGFFCYIIWSETIFL